MGGHAMNDEPNTGSFPTTQWPLIVNAIQKGNHAAAEAALNRFCEKYRPAIVNFFPRRVGTVERAVFLAVFPLRHQGKPRP
jgi:hypothetical protein